MSNTIIEFMNEASRHSRDFKQRISLFALAKIGSISFGCSFVTDKSRVPKPETGITAFLNTSN